MGNDYNTMFNSLVNTPNQKTKNQRQNLEPTKIEKTKQNVEPRCTPSEKTKGTPNDYSTSNKLISDSNESLVFNFVQQKPSDDSFKKKELYDQVKSLHCLFTWNLVSHNKQNVLSYIQNKYGNNNIDISKCVPSSKFTFVRFIGSLIMSYDLYKSGDLDASRMTILEIGNWLEKLDKSTDTFYLSIKTGLKHISVASFIFMQFDQNEGGYKWLFDEIVLFNNMDNISKAAVHAIHAIILIEFAENLDSFKDACKYADKACTLDPKTYYWYHIYSLVLIAQKHFEIHQSGHSTDKLCKIEKEIRLSIRRAIVITLDVRHIYPVYLILITTLNKFLAFKFQTELKELCDSKLPVDSNNNNDNENLEKDLKIVAEKFKNGKDPISHLNYMITKYSHYNKQIIMAQICSYKVLFTKDLRSGVEQFLALIEELEVHTSDIIVNHNSIFIHGSRIFNLAKLIYNEMVLVTVDHFSSIPFDDILFYYKVIIKIKETYGITIKQIDQSMKNVLNNNSLVKHLCTNMTNLNKNDLSKFENITLGHKNKNHKPKNPQSTDTQALIDKLGKTCNMKCEIYQVESNQTDLIDFRMLDSFSFGNKLSNGIGCATSENVINFQMKTKTQQYTMSQDALINTDQQYNFLVDTYRDSIGHFNQTETQQFLYSNLTMDLRFDFSLQSTFHTNDVITTNVTSDSMIIDTSLHKLPKSFSKTKYKNYLNNLLKKYPFSFKIYTDASKIENSVGIAIVSDKDNFSYKLSPDYSSSDAEAVAILRALDYALTECIYDFVILSDSLSTLQCIQTLNMNSSDVIKSIVGLLHAHKIKRNIVQFIWVPSHYAIEGNEKADKMAKQIASTKSAIVYSHNSFKINNVK